MYNNISWLFENVLQTVIGIAGLLANASAIPILCSKEMSSIFNRLLVLLAVYDNFYIICSLLEAMRKRNSHSEIHEHAFAYGLYQLHNFVLCGSIFLTVALALERYRYVRLICRYIYTYACGTLIHVKTNVSEYCMEECFLTGNDLHFRQNYFSCFIHLFDISKKIRSLSKSSLFTQKAFYILVSGFQLFSNKLGTTYITPFGKWEGCKTTI